MSARACAPGRHRRDVWRESGLGVCISVRVRECRRADREHKRSNRQYAHVGHVHGVVCIAKALWRIPARYQRGVLFHELGHMALAPAAHTEAAADREAERRYGVRIQHRDTRWGRRLQDA
jgi:hypothetical protein